MRNESDVVSDDEMVWPDWEANSDDSGFDDSKRTLPERRQLPLISFLHADPALRPPLLVLEEVLIENCKMPNGFAKFWHDAYEAFSESPIAFLRDAGDTVYTDVMGVSLAEVATYLAWRLQNPEAPTADWVSLSIHDTADYRPLGSVCVSRLNPTIWEDTSFLMPSYAVPLTTYHIKAHPAMPALTQTVVVAQAHACGTAPTIFKHS